MTYPVTKDLLLAHLNSACSRNSLDRIWQSSRTPDRNPVIQSVQIEMPSTAQDSIVSVGRESAEDLLSKGGKEERTIPLPFLQSRRL